VPEQISFEVHGLEELEARLAQGDTRMKIELNEGLRRLARLFVSSKGVGPLADATPKRTGKLARSTFFQIIGSTVNQTLKIMQPARTPEGAFYGHYVREGTDPHEIRPRNAKALRFEIAGEVIFAAKVNHPGTKPNPYHKRVMARMRGQVQYLVNEMGRKVTAYLSGG